MLVRRNLVFPDSFIPGANGPGEIAGVAEGKAGDVEQKPPKDAEHRPTDSCNTVVVIVDPEELPPVPRAEIDLLKILVEGVVGRMRGWLSIGSPLKRLRT